MSEQQSSPAACVTRGRMIRPAWQAVPLVCAQAERLAQRAQSSGTLAAPVIQTLCRRGAGRRAPAAVRNGAKCPEKISQEARRARLAVEPVSVTHATSNALCGSGGNTVGGIVSRSARRQQRWVGNERNRGYQTEGVRPGHHASSKHGRLALLAHPFPGSARPPSLYTHCSTRAQRAKHSLKSASAMDARPCARVCTEPRSRR